jgi:hypothetical protein
MQIMIRSSRCAAVILSGGALALTASVLPAQAATTGWRVSATFAVRGSANLLSGVDAVSKGDAWAVGFTLRKTNNAAPRATIRHWTGKKWNLVTLPAKTAKSWNKDDPFLSEVGASSSRNVWIFDDFSGRYLRLNGKRWSIGHLPGSSTTGVALVELTAVKVFSSTNVWAFGQRESVAGDKDVTAPYAAHYNGSKWSTTKVPVPASDGGTIAGVASVSPGQIWAVEDTDLGPSDTTVVPGPPVVLEWTSATGWQDAATQPALATGDQLSTVAARPNGDVWFGGSRSNSAKGTTPLAAEWNGTTWSVAALPAAASTADWTLASLAADGTGGLWAIASADNRGTQRLWHLHGGTWSQVTPNFGKHEWDLEALAQVPHTSSVWGVGATRRGSSADGLIGIEGPTPR